MARGCVIFDFDGVIADTEVMHWWAYNEVLAGHVGEVGASIEITREGYFGRYIVYGDREAFFHMLRDHGRPPGEAVIEKLARAKHELFQKRLAEGDGEAGPLPGVRELLTWLEERNVPRAICSGARRSEIETLLGAFRLKHHFDVMVTIEDVRNGKPDPEGYNLAFEKLNLEYDAELEKDFSLVIEDSEGGCAAGRAAGLRVLGVATSLPLKEVARCATFAVEGLDALDKTELARWLGLRV